MLFYNIFLFAFLFLGWSWSLPLIQCYESPSIVFRHSVYQIYFLESIPHLHCIIISSVQFSCSVVSNSLWSHGPQHARPPCPSPSLRVYSNSCPLSRWCHPTISSSVIPFSSGLQFFAASESFQISQFFASGGKGLEFQLQHQSFQWIFRTDFL